MKIVIKNNNTLLFDEFKFKCCTGSSGFAKNKIEGDKKTPRGIFYLDKLYFRSDRVSKPRTKLKCIKIKKSMGWCNDIRNKKKYNKLININNNNSCSFEKLYRRDFKYDYMITIKYNWQNPVAPKGSAIFIHLTKNYKSTLGCIALSKKDFIILASLVQKKTKIKIN